MGYRLICPRYYCKFNDAKGKEPKYNYENNKYTVTPLCTCKNVVLNFGNNEPDMYCENFEGR